MVYIIVAVTLLTVVGVVLGIYSAAEKKRCPHCQKLNALVYSRSQLLKEEPVSLLETHDVRDKNGKIIGTTQQRVYVTRQHLRSYYRCKYCKEVTAKLEYQIKK